MDVQLKSLSGVPLPGLILARSTGRTQDCGWNTLRSGGRHTGGERAQRRVLKRKRWKMEQPKGQKPHFYRASRSDSELTLHPHRLCVILILLELQTNKKYRAEFEMMQIWSWIKCSIKITCYIILIFQRGNDESSTGI